MIDLTQSHDSIVLVKNKAERVDGLESAIVDMKDLNTFPPATAAKVYGRLNFAEAQCSGRWLAPIMEPAKRRAMMTKAVRHVTSEIEEALGLAAKLLRSAPPRRLDVLGKEPPCLVFTDGAYEQGVASCGAVIFSPKLARPLAFGFTVPEWIVDTWRAHGHEQVITQAELLPVVVVKKDFKEVTQGARVLYFIDNEGVKEALVTGVTKSIASRTMLVEAMLQDAYANSLNWYSKVPSPSNVADAPSRLKWKEVYETIDCVRVDVSSTTIHGE